MRIILYDKSFLELEDVLKSGINLEKVMFSPFIRQKYHEHKPLLPGTRAQDITDPAIRPFVHIVRLGENGNFQVRITDGADDSASVERSPDCLLSGLPISTAVNLGSPASSVRSALAWLWPHGQLPTDRVQVRYADGAALTELDGASLLAASAPATAAAARRFGFSGSAYVPGDCVVLFDGVSVPVWVNQSDATPRSSGLGQILTRAFMFFGSGFYYLAVAALLSFVSGIAYLLLVVVPNTPAPPGPGDRVLVPGPAGVALPGVVRAVLPDESARVALDRGGEVTLPLDALQPLPKAPPAAAPAPRRDRH